MEEILHHLGCIIPCKQLDIYHINWCRISEPSTVLTSPFCTTESHSRGTEKTPNRTQEMDDARHALECALLKALASLKVPLEVRALDFFTKKWDDVNVFIHGRIGKTTY